jgi:hypothetical protein
MKLNAQLFDPGLLQDPTPTESLFNRPRKVDLRSKQAPSDVGLVKETFEYYFPVS